jgi:3',5'-nucleoside bisphosphate phosphatase
LDYVKKEFMSADLHIHSVYSDGSQTPTELVRLASRKRLQAISLTDHDTMDGTTEAVEAGAKWGMEIIPGLELSAIHDEYYVHILGYGMNGHDPDLTAGLCRLQNAREERNLKIVARIQEMGFPITMEEVKRISKIGQTGRPHIAKALMAHGAVKDSADAFERFLRKGGPAYVSRFVFSAEKAIDMIKKAGGIAVLAHPIQIDPSLKRFPVLLGQLVTLGLDGIELYYPTQSAGIRKKIRLVADRYQLLYTGGSDYHGDTRPGTHLAGGKNVYVPSEIVATLTERLSEKKKHG